MDVRAYLQGIERDNNAMRFWLEEAAKAVDAYASSCRTSDAKSTALDIAAMLREFKAE